ncbi:MAG TPA: hypothetical protein VNO24_27885 [Blastocatellia bacterium]|nr:hypothetical protein [Blastocatellia bacterium]
MSDEIKSLLQMLRYWETEPCLPGPAKTCKEARELIEQQAARIAELEALLVKANDSWLAMSGIAAPVADSEELSLRAQYEDACIAANKNAKDAETWRNLLSMLIHEIDKGRRWGPYLGAENAPGHGHARIGIWDNDNGALSGTQCAWCAIWNEARAAVSASGR